MSSNRCTVPGCYRVKWNTAGVCHTHAGAREQWLANIDSSGTVMTSIETESDSPKTSSKKKKAPSTPSGVAANPKVPVQNNSGSAFPSHLQLEQLGLGPARLPWMAGVNPQIGPALSSGQSTLLPALYHQLVAVNAANRLQESLYPDQASYLSGQPVRVAMLPPHMMVPSPSMGQGNRDTGSDGDLSVFKLTPSHNKGRTARPGDGGSTESRGSQDSRSWHTPRAEVSSGEALLHPVPVVMQQVTTGSEQRDSSVEDSSHTWQSTRPKAAHSQPSISEHLQEANSVVQSSAQNVEAQLGNRSRDREEDVFVVDDEDVFVVDDEDVVFVGVDLSLSRTESNNKNFNSSKSELLSASNQQALPLTTAETKNDESDDDCIILDLSLGLSSEQEDSEQENSSMHTVEKDGFLGEGINQGEKAVCEQASLSAVSSGQDCESATQDTENVEPSEIMVLETVSLSEQQNTYLDQDATPKSYCQLSAESYYRCGCSEGCCGFRTVLPSQLELHLQEEHPYDVIYPCVHCGSREAGINSLICHLEQHLAPQNLSLHCSDMLCHFMSSLPEEVLSHIRLSHPNQASHFCWLCTTKFDNLTMFFSHVQENLLRVFKCQLCSARDVDRQGILNHMASSHPDQGHLIAVQKIFICQERKVHYWNAAEGNAEGLTVAKQGGAPMPGSSDEDVASTRSEQTGISSSMTSRKTSDSLPQQGKSAPHELSPSPEAQEKERSCIKTQKQKLETRKKEVTIHSPSKNKLLRRLLVDGSINTSPSDVTAKLTGTNTTPAADKTKLPNTDTSLTADQSQPPDLSTVHAVVEAVLATEKAGSSKKQSGLHSASQRELPSKSSQQLTKMDSGSSDTIVDVVGTNDAEWSIESPQQRTRMNSGSSGCSLDVMYTNDTEWSSKSSQQRARTESGSSGSTLDVTYTNDTEWSSKSPQQRARTESGSSDSTIDIMYTKENSAGTETQDKTRASGTGCTLPMERRLRGVLLMCNICGLTGPSRSGMQLHMYSQHADMMACPVCSDTLGNDCQLQKHLSDMHPDMCSAFQRMKSQNFITQVSSAGGEKDVSSRKESVSEEMGGSGWPGNEAVEDKPLVNGDLQDEGDQQNQNHTTCTSSPLKTFKTELLACKFCGFSSRNVMLVKSHLYDKHPEVAKCPKCEVKLAGDRKLYRHLGEAHPGETESLYQQHRSLSWIVKPDDTSEQLSCKLCGYFCTQSDAAYNHMYTEHKDVMKCPNCRVELGSDQELYQHLSEDHNDERDVLYSQHCSVSWFETSKKNREWTASRITGRPTMLRIKKRPPAKKNSTRHRLSETGCETVASMPSSSAAGMPALHQSSDLADRIPLILTGELTSEVSVSFSNGCSEMSMSVPLMTAEQYDALAAEEVIDNKEFRCPHCTSDFKWRYKFYEHLCYHYHYRCFRCAHCLFLAFCGSSVVNHNKKAHNVEPIVEHLPEANLERRIERVISQSLAVVTQPHTERRLLAYERARLKKQNKCRQAPNKKLVKKPKSPLKPRKVLTSKSEEVLSENMSENNKKSPKRSRPKKVVTWQSNTDSEGRGTWLRCPYCRGPKKRQEAVEIEIRYHIHYKPYICSYCKHASGSENCIKRHLAATHPQENAVIGYERIEQKEKRFVILMKKAFELSETTAKTHLMSSVKKKYKKVVGSGNKAGMSGGQIEATRSPGKVTRSHGKVVTTNPGKVTRSHGKVVTRSPGKAVTTNPGKEVTRSPGKVVTRSPGKVVTRSPGKVVTRSPGKVVTTNPGKVTRSPGKVVTRSPGKVVTRSPKKDMKNSADQQTGPGLYIQCAHCNFSGITREAVMGHLIEHHQHLLHLNRAVAAPSTLTAYHLQIKA
ncbi:hypothetical protein ACOMHN_038416 [Nucella lapillus]